MPHAETLLLVRREHPVFHATNSSHLTATNQLTGSCLMLDIHLGLSQQLLEKSVNLVRDKNKLTLQQLYGTEKVI